MPDWCDEAAKRIGEWEFEMFRGEPYCKEWLDKMARIIREEYAKREVGVVPWIGEPVVQLFPPLPALFDLNQPLPGRNIGDGQ